MRSRQESKAREREQRERGISNIRIAFMGLSPFIRRG
jgi:hypothetical protein